MSMAYGGLGYGGNTGWGPSYDASSFPDPFCDMASLAMPESIQHALRWCEFIFLANGTYREATRRLIAYFITNVELGKASDEVKENWKTFLNETLDIKNVLQIVGLDTACFHGDTNAVTDKGVFKLRDLVGQTVNVLSKDGVYRPADFKHFGRQELLEVTFSDGRTVLATPEHQWFAKNCSGKDVKVPTTSLRKGYRIPRVVAPRPEKNEDYREGVRHGFVFGDGSLYNKKKPGGARSRALFYGDKDKALLPFFAGKGRAPRTYPGKDYAFIFGLPGHYKQLPPNDASASYWYGFVSGLLAADGTVDIYGCAMLTQISKATLEAIEKQLPRLGMVAGPIRGQRRITDLRKYSKTSGIYDTTIHFMTLLKQFMQADDFLIHKHREKFEQHYKPSKYGEYVGVKSVRKTGIVDDVFCCVEMETHSFVINNAVLTGQCYGNSFTAVVPTFTRYLMCPQCRSLEKPLGQLMNEPVFKFQWSNYKFHATCPKCKYEGAWRHTDRPTGEHNGFRIKRFSPHDIELRHDEWTNKNRYIWKIPEDYRRDIRQGYEHVITTAPIKVIQAVQNDSHLEFDDDFIHHMKEESLAGYINRGWGISRVLANFRQAWYVQVLHRYNEAIALDYVIPFRLITPAPGDKSTGADLLTGGNAGNFMGQVHRMLQSRRWRPTQWNSLPFPVQYQALGGDAKALAPSELINQGQETLLNNIGIPAELYRASLTLQAAPTALRLFEAANSSVPHNFNNFLRFVVRKVSSMLRWEPVTVKLEKVQHADDANRQLTKLQLMTGGVVSQTTGLKAVGVEFKDEVQQQMDDQRYQAEEQAKLQDQMDQAAQMKSMFQQPQQGGQPGQPGQPQAGGQPQQGGQPGDPNMQPGMAGQSIVAGLPQGPNQKITPEEMLQRAQYLASQLMGMPEAQKDSELIKLKKMDPNLHAMVKGQINDIRQQARTQGGAQVLAQQFGKQGAAVADAQHVQKQAAAILRSLRTIRIPKDSKGN